MGTIIQPTTGLLERTGGQRGRYEDSSWPPTSPTNSCLRRHLNIWIPGAGPGPNSRHLKRNPAGGGCIWDQSKGEEIRRSWLGARTRKEDLQGGAGASVCVCGKGGGSCRGPGHTQPRLLETPGLSLPLSGTCFSICQSSPSPLPKAMLPAPEPLTS